MRIPEGLGPRYFKITAPLSGNRPSGNSGGAGGPAGGDLGGTLPGPTVVGLQGVPVCVTAPVFGDVLTFDGAQWCPSSPTPSTSFLTKVDGEGHTVKDHGTVGATETVNPADGNWHLVTLGANCTLTFTSPALGPGCLIQLFITGDGASGITWPAAVIWPGGTAPTLTTTAGNVDTITLATYDGGVNWYGSFESGGGFTAGGDLTGTSTSQTVAKINGSPLGTTTGASVADRLRWGGAAWSKSSLVWVPLTVYDGTNWLPLVDGSGNAIMSEV